MWGVLPPTSTAPSGTLTFWRCAVLPWRVLPRRVLPLVEPSPFGGVQYSPGEYCLDEYCPDEYCPQWTPHLLEVCSTPLASTASTSTAPSGPLTFWRRAILPRRVLPRRVLPLVDPSPFGGVQYSSSTPQRTLIFWMWRVLSYSYRCKRSESSLIC